jgi:flagellar operon protein
VIATIDRIGPGPAALAQSAPSGLTGLPGTSPLGPPGSTAPQGQTNGDFRDALTTALGEHSLQFSEHAMRRVEQRQIPFQGDQLNRLQKAMDTLSQRGSRGQSLVMLDQYAYVVHAPSHTVVTAVEPDQSKERVFTQIDSVVIA